MNIQARIFRFVTRTNWVIFTLATVTGILTLPKEYTVGIFLGGLLVTVNFHLLWRTLKTALTPPFRFSPNVVLAKYYVRFLVTGIIIFILIAGHLVHPVGLIIGLSVVVVSILLATVREIKYLVFKEAI